MNINGTILVDVNSVFQVFSWPIWGIPGGTSCFLFLNYFKTVVVQPEYIRKVVETNAGSFTCTVWKISEYFLDKTGKSA
jgi:hypothetical protein